MLKRFLAGLLAARRKRTKLLLGLWTCFLLLVVLGIHGSSTGYVAAYWSPEKPYSGYLFWNPPVPPDFSPAAAAKDDFRNHLFMASSQVIRWDEYMISTPLSLSQLSHQPKFPVVNTNIGIGQNMLIYHQVPVWHITTLARPGTWGYFLFGAQRGLAWHWWFQPFACFTALFLLFEILLKGKNGLAAFGAFWYCASAYIVCWSQWPAYMTFFIATGCVSAYYIFATQKLSTLIVCATLLGLSLPGFVMFIYPPWQVALGYLFLLIFASLFVRDKLYVSFKALYLYRLLALFGALVLAGALIGAYLQACLPDMKIMSATIYPGQRVSLGGDTSFALLFEGMYNLATLFTTPPGLLNSTESASFYYLFPAVILAMCLSRRFLRGMGIVGWLVVLYLAGMIFFLCVGLPESIAKLTLLSYVPTYRADIAIGLASIILCMQALSLAGDQGREVLSRWETWVPWLVSGAVAVFFVLHGLAFLKLTAHFLPTLAAVAVTLLAAIASYFLLRGKSAVFCGLMGAVVVATTAFFNPLATTLHHLYDSELAQQIVHFNKQAADSRPLWVCYGGTHPGTLVTMLGGRSVSGIHWPPQLSLWQKLDTFNRYEQEYNRFAYVELEYGRREEGVRFKATQLDKLVVTISPQAPILKNLGARYVLALGEAQYQIQEEGLPLLYASVYGNFSIYELQP